MGLSFQGSEAHWSYGGFNRFRQRLAEKVGLEWPEARAFISCSPAAREEDNARWQKLQSLDDPIRDLLCHSDCDGELSPEQCATIAPRLKELVADWDANDFDKMQADLLVQGMLDCAESKEPLEFT